MGKLISDLQFNGQVGSLVAYRLPGVEKIVVRSKGHVPYKQYKTAPRFEHTRQLNTEFSGRSVAAGWLMHALRPVKLISDYNLSGTLNSLLRIVQLEDTNSPRGERSIRLSRNRELLTGLSFSRLDPLETVMLENIGTSIDREAGSAHVHVPDLLAGHNFAVPKQHEWFSLQAVLAIMPDFFYTKPAMRYQPLPEYHDMARHTLVETPWQHVQERFNATTLTLALDTVPRDHQNTLVLTLGVRYGIRLFANHIEQVKRSGSARVMRTG